MTGTLLDSYMPFDTGPGSNVSEDGWRQFAKYFSGDGIKRGILNGFNTFGDSSGRQVKVDTGECQIQGQWGKCSSIKTLAIAANPSGPNNRLDLVVLRNDFVANQIVVDVLTGTSATVLPALTQNTSMWEVQLGIVTVPTSAVTITAGNVQFIPACADINLGGQTRTGASGSITTVESSVVTTGKFALLPNSVYQVWFKVSVTSASASGDYTARIRANSNSGTQVDIGIGKTDATGFHSTIMLSGFYSTTSAENTNFVGTLTGTSGNAVNAGGGGATNMGANYYGPSSNVGSLP